MTDGSVAEDPVTMGAFGVDTVVRFHPLLIRPSDDDPDTSIVGRPEVGEFIELPTVGAEAIRLLDAGAPVGEAERRVAAEYGMEVDLADLVAALAGAGFVAEVDGHARPDPHRALPSHLPWLTARHVRWLFSTPVKLTYVLLVGATLFTVVRRPDLLPSFRDFYWTDYVGLAVLVNTAMLSLAATAHELGHLAAARSLGAPGRISFATRLHHLVLQTDVTAVWAVPRRYRYRVYLSGILLDFGVVCVALLLIAYPPLPSLLDGLLAALVVVTIASMALQARVYMRTDLYFVLMELLRCGNLFHDGLGYARYLLRRLGHAIAPAHIGLVDDPTVDLPARERRAVRFYALAVVVGSVVALSSFAVFGIPIAVYGAWTAVSSIINGVTGSGSLLAAVDGVLILVVEGVLQAIFLVTFYRRYRHRLHRLLPGRARTAAQQ